MSKSVRWAFNFGKWSPTESEITLASACVQQEEKDRLARFVFKKDFKSSLIGRLMMRKFIAENSGLSYRTVEFVRDKHGKPLLKPTVPNLSFNVSHQGDYTVFAGETDGRTLGVDVMKLEYTGGKTLDEFFRLMNRYIAGEEWAAIKSRPTDPEKIAVFCRHWSLKESYVKAIGVGITIDFRDVSFRIKSERLGTDSIVTDTELYCKNEKQNWFFEEMMLGDDHCVSVALDRKSSALVKFEEITFDQLVKDAVPLLDFDKHYCDEFFKKLDK